MNYFQPYSLPADQTILATWDSQLAELVDCPDIINALVKQHELFPRFAAYYAQLRALPHGTRRVLQRKLARAGELVALRPEWQRKLASSLAGAALLLALAQSARAATINVTTNVPDINDGDGKCSLIEAIINANDDAATHPDCAAGSGGRNTIVLPDDSTVKLSTSYTNYYGHTGLPVIKRKVVIEGNGATISRAIDAPLFRLLAVSSSGDLTLKNTTVTGGSLYSKNIHIGFYDRSQGYSGGAIFNNGKVEIIGTTISGNHSSGTGGGLYNGYYGLALITDSTISENKAHNFYGRGAGGGLCNAGTLTIKNSKISGNVAAILPQMRRYDSYGGGMCNLFGVLNVSDTLISGNVADGHRSQGDGTGGGISNYAGIVSITNSTISANKGGRAGGIFSRGYIVWGYYLPAIVHLEKSIVSENKGAGLYHFFGTATITNTSILDNVTNAKYSGRPGGGIVNLGFLYLMNSTVAGNISRGDQNHTASGGGLFNEVYSYVTNSTISANSVTGNNFSSGGGIANTGYLTLTNSTISGNSAQNTGGGISVNMGQVYLHNNLITGNNAIAGSEVSILDPDHGFVHANDFNIFGYRNNANVAGFTPGPTDIVPTVALKNILGPLQNNGGPTSTHALVKGSPAIDGAPKHHRCPDTDQRGMPRPQGKGCDIGAVEYTSKSSGKKTNLNVAGHQ